jgi:hypothetical protein
LKVDEELEFGRLHDGQVGGLCALIGSILRRKCFVNPLHLTLGI